MKSISSQSAKVAPIGLRAQAASGVKWTAISIITTTVLLYTRLLVLARLLPTEDFGLMGMLLVIISIGQTFSDMGLSQGLIWRQDATREQLSTLYWLNLIAGFAVGMIVFSVAPLVSKFFAEPRLTSLVIWIALIFPIRAFGQQYQAIMQRDLQFRRLAAIEIASTAIGVAVAIVAAFADRGVLALIWGQVGIFLSASFLYMATGWRAGRPQAIFKPGAVKEILWFGVHNMGQRIFFSVSSNVDYIMVGRYLGTGILGVYTLAWQVMIAPLTKINTILMQVAFPVFAKKQDDNNTLTRGYEELSKIISLVTVPAVLVAAAAAPAFVPVIFGSKWNDAVPLMQILSFFTVARSFSDPSMSLLLAKGRSDMALKVTAFTAISGAIAFWFAAQLGATQMAVAEVVIGGLALTICLLALKKLGCLQFKRYLQAILRPLMMAATSAFFAHLGYLVFKSYIESEPLLLVATIVMAATAYLLLVGVFERNYFLSYFRLLFRRGST